MEHFPPGLPTSRKAITLVSAYCVFLFKQFTSYLHRLSKVLAIAGRSRQRLINKSFFNMFCFAWSWLSTSLKGQADYKRLKDWKLFLRKIIEKVTNFFKSSCLILAKYGGMKRLVVTIDNISVQERHIFQTSRPSFSSEPPSFLLKSEFVKTCRMTR